MAAFERERTVETICRYGYLFHIDWERTHATYEKRLSAGSWLRGALPELTEFLADLGIDVERPDNSAEDWSDLVYTAYGTFQAYEGGYEIDVSGPEKPASCCLFQIAEDRFCVEVFGLVP